MSVPVGKKKNNSPVTKSVVAVNLSDSLISRLRRRANELDMSVSAVAEIALSLALKEDFDAGQLNRPSEYPNRNGKLSITIQPPRGAPQTWEAYFRGSPRTALIELIETLNLP